MLSKSFTFTPLLLFDPAIWETLFLNNSLTLLAFTVVRFQGIETQARSAYLDLPTVGYQGHQTLYKKPVTNIEHRKDPFFNVNPMRPRLKDRDVRTT